MAKAIPVTAPSDCPEPPDASAVLLMEPAIRQPSVNDIRITESRALEAAQLVNDVPVDPELVQLFKAAKTLGKNVVSFGNAVRVDL